MEDNGVNVWSVISHVSVLAWPSDSVVNYI